MSKVVVIGDACRDIFYYGFCDRIAPESPVPILNIEKIESNGGMAMNVVNNLRSLGVECDAVVNREWENLTKERYVSHHTNHMFLRVDNDLNKYHRCDELSNIDFSLYDVVVVSDYDKGFLLEEDIKYICSKTENVFLDTKKKLGPWCKNAKIIKINTAEFLKTKDTISQEMKKKIIVTMGPLGSKYRGEIFPTPEVEIKDVSGAGDSFLSGLVVKYAQTKDIIKSIKFATECATRVVQKRGVSVP